jgi:MFS family permease
MSAGPLTIEKKNTPRQVLVTSLIGTTIEFFDFYIYATAAVLVFPALFFPESDPVSARLASLATFGIAFFARPVGSALFGHFGWKTRAKGQAWAMGTCGFHAPVRTRASMALGSMGRAK